MRRVWVCLHEQVNLISLDFITSIHNTTQKGEMNPLAAALLAAQGWDVSRLQKQSQGHGSESNVSQAVVLFGSSDTLGQEQSTSHRHQHSTQ
jgi:hypothetical protein